MTEISMSDITEVKEKKTMSKKKMFPMNAPPKKTYQTQETPQQQFNNYFEGYIPDELKGGIQNLLLYGLSIPAPKHKRRRMLLNLHQSTYTKQYLNKYLHVDMLSILDDHSKALLVYGLNYIDAFMSADVMEPLEQRKEQKQKDIPEQNNEIK
jgi:hypothetical protein